MKLYDDHLAYHKTSPLFHSPYPQNLLLKLVKNMRRKTPMRSEHLPRHHIASPQLPLGNKSNMIPLRVHDNVLIRLLKPNQDIHNFELPLNDNSRIGQDFCRRMLFMKHSIRVFENTYWR